MVSYTKYTFYSETICGHISRWSEFYRNTRKRIGEVTHHVCQDGNPTLKSKTKYVNEKNIHLNQFVNHVKIDIATCALTNPWPCI
jgi:hypothetical protein